MKQTHLLLLFAVFSFLCSCNQEDDLRNQPVENTESNLAKITKVKNS